MNRKLLSLTRSLEKTTSTAAATENNDPFDYTHSVHERARRVQKDWLNAGDDGLSSSKLTDASETLMPSITIDAKASSSETVAIILDWDDTLFPTTWMRRVQATLYKHVQEKVAQSRERHTFKSEHTSPPSDIDLWSMFELRHLASSDRVLLRRLELSSIDLLKNCMQKSTHLYIITNAQYPWVTMSALKFMPKLLAVVQKNNIPIISARDTYLAMHANGADTPPEVWKISAFQSLMATFLDRTFTSVPENLEDEGGSNLRRRSAPSRRWWRRSWRGNGTHTRTRSTCETMSADDRCMMISIGDSDCERVALLRCRDLYFNQAWFKSIKLIESPHPLLLKRQQDFIRRSLSEVLSIPDSLDIIFEPPIKTVTSTAAC